MKIIKNQSNKILLFLFLIISLLFIPSNSQALTNIPQEFKSFLNIILLINSALVFLILVPLFFYKFKSISNPIEYVIYFVIEIIVIIIVIILLISLLQI